MSAYLLQGSSKAVVLAVNHAHDGVSLTQYSHTAYMEPNGSSFSSLECNNSYRISRRPLTFYREPNRVGISSRACHRQYISVPTYSLKSQWQ